VNESSIAILTIRTLWVPTGRTSLFVSTDLKPSTAFCMMAVTSFLEFDIIETIWLNIKDHITPFDGAGRQPREQGDH